MSNPFHLIVFDWEGTIADTLGQILHTVTEEANLLGFGTVQPDEAREYVCLGLVQLLRKLYPHLVLRQQEQLLLRVQQALSSRSTEVCLIPGAQALIKRLHDEGVDLAIATNKGHHSLLRALQSTGLDEFFKITRSAGQVPPKPSPQMLEEIMDEFGVSTEATLMIGDSVSDMEMAKNINVRAIGVDFYHQQEAALKAAGALEVFDDYQQVADYLGIST